MKDVYIGMPDTQYSNKIGYLHTIFVIVHKHAHKHTHSDTLLDMRM